MIWRAAWLVVICAFGKAAMAEPVGDPDILHGCLGAAEDTAAARACLGGMSSACMDAPDGGTTLGMAMCTAAETAVWDQYLNDVYRALRDAAKAMDRAEAETFPEFANRADALLTAQRAWIAFRDGECGYVYARWGSGSMRTIVGASCHLDMTAARYLVLRDYLADADMR